MISLEEIVKWGAVAAPIATAAVTVTLFVLYRSDYIRAGHPEPTLIAFRLTKSTLANWARFRRGEKRPEPMAHARRGDTEPHAHRRQTDFGTVNRPIAGIEGLEEAIKKRRTPPQRRKSDGSASE